MEKVLSLRANYHVSPLSSGMTHLFGGVLAGIVQEPI